jgi:hypothetical protein
MRLRRNSSGSTPGILTFTRLAQRSLALQPGNSLISIALTLSVGFSMSVTLHAVIQGYPPQAERDFPHHLTITLWITTAIHLDTQTKKPHAISLTTPPFFSCYLTTHVANDVY